MNASTHTHTNTHTHSLIHDNNAHMNKYCQVCNDEGKNVSEKSVSYTDIPTEIFYLQMEEDSKCNSSVIHPYSYTFAGIFRGVSGKKVTTSESGFEPDLLKAKREN